MRELGWPVPVFFADGRKNMPSSRSGYIVCFFKRSKRALSLKAIQCLRNLMLEGIPESIRWS